MVDRNRAELSSGISTEMPVTTYFSAERTMRDILADRELRERASRMIPSLEALGPLVSIDNGSLPKDVLPEG